MSFIVSRLPGLSENPVYLRLTIVMAALMILSGLWAVVSILGIRVVRTTRFTRKQVGEIITENYEIINGSIFPKVWLKISDEAHLPGGSGSRVIAWIGARASRTYVAYTFLQKRGWFTLGPTFVETGDLFNLFLVKKQFSSQTRLLVQPYMVDIQSFPAPSGIQPGGRALKQKTLDVTPYAAGVREFLPGDPLKRIHWPSSARKQKLIVKEFEKDPMAEVWLFLDIREDIHFQSPERRFRTITETWWMKQRLEYLLPPDTEEYTISIAASLAKYYIAQKREVGLVSGGESLIILPAERGERQLGKLLETLSVMKTGGNLPLWGVVNSQLKHLVKGATVILITPSQDEQIMSLVMTLLMRGLMPVVILLDRPSFEDQGSSMDLNSKLRAHGIMSYIVKKGDDIKQVLETPLTAPVERVHYIRS